MLFLLACAEPPTLRWVRGYAAETPELAEVGLRWQLSLLGGEDVTVGWRGDGDSAEVSFIGVQPDLAEAVTESLSGEAEARGSIDLGRWLMRALYEPESYYAFVEAPLSFDDVTEPVLYVVTTSLLTDSPRRIHLPTGPDFVMTAAEGELQGETFVPGELERIDLMANGQQRFMVFDAEGERIPASAGPAGGPGRCMWCHENDVQLGVPESNPATAGGISGEQFAVEVERLELWLAEARTSNTSVSWDVASHEHGELLVQPFLRPSLSRLAREWGRETGEVEVLLNAAGLEPSEDPEYPAFGELYRRADVDAVLGAAWAPDWEPVAVAESFR